MLRGEFTVHQEVVHSAAVFLAHHAVEHLSGLETADFVREDIIHEGLGLGTLDENLTHVGDVEHAHFTANGIVLLGDGTVLDRHHEAGEGAHLGSHGYVPFIETGLFEFLIHN